MNESALKVILELGPKYGVDLWKHVETRRSRNTEWLKCLQSCDIDLEDDYEYRVKPRTHIVNGIECPEPMSVRPAAGQYFWYINHSADDGVLKAKWAGCAQSNECLFRVGIFHTREDALDNFYAHYPHMRTEAQ